MPRAGVNAPLLPRYNPAKGALEEQRRKTIFVGIRLHSPVGIKRCMPCGSASASKHTTSHIRPHSAGMFRGEIDREGVLACVGRPLPLPPAGAAARSNNMQNLLLRETFRAANHTVGGFTLYHARHTGRSRITVPVKHGLRQSACMGRRHTGGPHRVPRSVCYIPHGNSGL